MATPSPVPASVGFYVKTGRAIAIVLAGPLAAPRVVLRRELALCSPDMAHMTLPYHAVMHLPWPQALAAAQAAERAVEGITQEAVADLAAQAGAAGYAIDAAGIAGSMGQDPARIGNPHIRAHAAEGQLFQRAVEAAARRHCGRCLALAPAQWLAAAAALLGQSAPALDARVRALGRGTVRPWRIEERGATLAAWGALALPPA
ncbi:MAG: hypothetical protein V4582_02935 [Pseudomonadota bacterium]